MPNLLRSILTNGLSDNHDRLWRIADLQGQIHAFTDYNWEVTSWSDGLQEWLEYGGNAYYWTSEFQRRGFKVEHLEDRR